MASGSIFSTSSLQSLLVGPGMKSHSLSIPAIIFFCKGNCMLHVLNVNLDNLYYDSKCKLSERVQFVYVILSQLTELEKAGVETKIFLLSLFDLFGSLHKM